MNAQAVVLVPALNAAATLPRQLAALDAQTELDFRVVVCDNGSTDETAQLCARWRPRFQSLGVIDASRRRGVAAARNEGIAGTDEELVLFCDADDAVHPTWFAALRRALGRADGATGPLHLVFPDEPQDETWNEFDVPTSMGFRHYLPGCSAAWRRDVFDAIGVYDEDLSLGQEDVDLGWRAEAAGFSLVHAPDAVIDYYQRPGLRPLLRQQFRYGRAHVQLYAKHRRDAPAPASYRASLRWFWEWLRQWPSALRTKRVRQSLAQACFQVGRLSESLRLHTKAPL